MTPPIACVWWPQALANGREPQLRWLRHWSPFVEPASDALGLYFLDAGGLEGLFDTQAAWAQALAVALRQGPPAWLLLGHHKTALWALARAAAQRPEGRATPHHPPFEGAQPPPRAVAVAAFASVGQERAALAHVPLSALALPDKEWAAARRWLLASLGDALSLPLPSVQEHVGSALVAWLGALQRPSEPLRPATPAPVVVATHALDDATEDRLRLLFLVKQLLDDVLAQASEHRRPVQALHLACWPRARAQAPPYVRRLESATPSLDARRWLELLRLAIEHAPLLAPMAELRLRAELALPSVAEQLSLWPERSSRQLDAACQALAKVRSAWGDDAVTRVELVDAHLPEAKFRYRPWRGERLPVARPAVRAAAQAAFALAPGAREKQLPRVRWMWPVPRALPASWQQRLRAGAADPESWVRGPFVYNVQWWRAEPCDRDYVYIGTPYAAAVWAFFDRRQRRWWWQGTVD